MSSENRAVPPRVLVTGATGHIGNVLVRKLLERGLSIRTVVLPGEDLSPLDGFEVEKLPGDILEPESLAPAFSGIQDVYHLAGVISVMPGNDLNVRRVNIQGTRNIIRLSKEASVRRLVYVSSIHAFQRLPHGYTIDESVAFNIDNPCGVYDFSKAEASLLVQDAAKLGLDAVIVCPTGVIGPYDYRCSDMGRLIRDAVKARLSIGIKGAYDFVDVRDVAEGIILSCERGKTGEIYILAGEQIEIMNIIKQAQRSAGRKESILQIPLSVARLAARFAPLVARITHRTPRFTSYALETVLCNSIISCDKARTELGYSARPLSISIRDTVNWFLNSPTNALSSG